MANEQKHEDVEPQDYIEPELPAGEYRYIPPGFSPEDLARLSDRSDAHDVPTTKNVRRNIGLGIAALGGLIALYSFTVETTAPYSETLNIGRLQDQMMIFQLGCAILISGVVAMTGGAILDHLERR